VNKAMIGGTISDYGVRLSYTPASKPQLSFSVDIIEGDYHVYVPCQIVGHNAEPLAETLEAGMYVVVDGKLSWKKDQQKLQVTAFGVERITTAGTTPHEPSPEYGRGSEPAEFNLGHARRPRKRPYPKAALEGSF